MAPAGLLQKPVRDFHPSSQNSAKKSLLSHWFLMGLPLLYSCRYVRVSNMNQVKKVSRAYLVSRLIQLHAFFLDGQLFLKTVCNHHKWDTYGHKWEIWLRYPRWGLPVLQDRLKVHTYMVAYTDREKFVELDKINPGRDYTATRERKPLSSLPSFGTMKFTELRVKCSHLSGSGCGMTFLEEISVWGN